MLVQQIVLLCKGGQGSPEEGCCSIVLCLQRFERLHAIGTVTMQWLQQHEAVAGTKQTCHSAASRRCVQAMLCSTT